MLFLPQRFPSQLCTQLGQVESRTWTVPFLAPRDYNRKARPAHLRAHSSCPLRPQLSLPLCDEKPSGVWVFAATKCAVAVRLSLAERSPRAAPRAGRTATARSPCWGDRAACPFALHSSDLVGQGPVLTSPPRDRLPCWVRLWENSSSLAGECDPVAGVLTASGGGAPAGPPPPPLRGTRIPLCRSCRLSPPRTSGHPRVTKDSTASRWLHAGDTLQRVSPRSLPLLRGGVQDSQGRRSTKQPCPGQAAPPPGAHPSSAVSGVGASGRTGSQRHPLVAPVIAGPSGHAREAG